MLETIFGSILTAGLTGSAFVICLLVALALGALVAAVYMYKNTYTQSMAVTLALLPAMVQVIILLVNGNLGAGVAVSGAFSLVRFRSAAGSARDITCIFLAMTLGLATGMGYIGIAIVTGAVMCILLTAYAALSFGRKPEEEKELKITIPENLDYTGIFDDIFDEYLSEHELVQVKTVDGPESTIIELSVGPDDMGKVIGKQGRIAKSIRSVVKAATARSEKPVFVEIL
mgnify:CR=1 FL=1